MTRFRDLLRGRRGGGGARPSRRASVRFALFAVFTSVLTGYLAVEIMGTDFQRSYRLTATFDDVSGLEEGDFVKVRGATVGRVHDIVVTGGRARVTVSVREDVRLPVDSVAEVRWRDLVGARELYLNPGASGRMLESGATVQHTKGTVDLGAVINTLGPLTGSLDPEQVNQILQSFAVALDGNQGDINQITTNLGLLLDTLGSRGDTIDRMLKDYRTVTDAVAARDEQIAEVVDNLTSLTRAFASSGTVLDRALVRTSGFTGNLDRAIGGSARELGRIVTSTRELLEIARSNMEVLSGIVNGLPASLQALLSVMDGGHFVRSAMVCLSIDELQDPCPFTPVLPFPPAQGPGGGQAGGEQAGGGQAGGGQAGGGDGAPRMSAAEREEFAKVASLFLLNAANAGGGR